MRFSYEDVRKIVARMVHVFEIEPGRTALVLYADGLRIHVIEERKEAKDITFEHDGQVVTCTIDPAREYALAIERGRDLCARTALEELGIRPQKDKAVRDRTKP